VFCQSIQSTGLKIRILSFCTLFFCKLNKFD
jgi:hypothetical protein